ncbi:hypothetical protein GCM10010169_24880 [Micromonospora fulviviridis]|nr:hypothetical protein GCM10010169_24880 [Micromonospora fulviviridis]
MVEPGEELRVTFPQLAGDLFEPALILFAEHGGAFPSRLQRFGGIPATGAGHAPVLLPVSPSGTGLDAPVGDLSTGLSVP